MKIAPLLAHYLQVHKRLDLPGIGSFILNAPIYPESDHPKKEKKAGIEEVSFESNKSVKQSPNLVQFITEKAGIIKALASADLESHLTLARQFLNIGNPFIFESIGILEKNKAGDFILKKGAGIAQSTDEFLQNKIPADTTLGKSGLDFKKILYYDKLKMTWRKPVAFILVLGGLALAIWGGYMVYQRTSEKKEPGKNTNKAKPIIANDSLPNQKDSLLIQVNDFPAGSQKFILEESNAQRAFERYGRLKTFLWDVKMETNDSVNYKLYLLIPATANDTNRIIDSLSLLSGRRVYIEK